MESAAPLALASAAIFRPTSSRIFSRSGSDEPSSASYPQLLIAASTVNRVSLWPMETLLWAAIHAGQAVSSAATMAVFRENNLEIRRASLSQMARVEQEH